MNTAFEKEIQLKLLNLLQNEPGLTQREMNQKMGVSLGKINYCISAFKQKGIIKVERFKKVKNKSVYMYLLTPKGVEEIAKLTAAFLKIKIAEYDKIKMEIKVLSEQIGKINSDLKNKSDLIND